MTFEALMKAAARQCEARDPADIKQMLERPAIPGRSLELAVLDRQFAVGVVGGEDTVLVVAEPAAA